MKNSPTVKTTASSFLDSVKLIVRPAVAFCLRRGVRLREITEIIKASAVEVAIEQLEAAGEPLSASKISLMTGVHRKDVTVLLESDAPRSPPVHPCIKVIGQWRTDKQFLTAEGKPRSISCKGIDSEFAKLVRKVNRELNAYSVLFELERIGAVSVVNESVKLLGNEYVPKGKLSESFALVSKDVNDLIKAAEQNILEPLDPPQLHLSTSYDNLIKEALPTIRQWCIDKGAEFHQAAREFFSQFDKDINTKLGDKEGGGRVVVGTFTFSDAKNPPPPPAPKRRRRKNG